MLFHQKVLFKLRDREPGYGASGPGSTVQSPVTANPRKPWFLTGKLQINTAPAPNVPVSTGDAAGGARGTRPT